MTEELYTRFVALLAAALLVPSVVFFAMAISHPQMRYWRLLGLGCIAIFFASLISALRDALPYTSLLMLSNLLVGIGYFLCVKALRSLQKDNKHNLTEYILLSAHALAAILINLTGAQYEYRVAVVSLVIVAFSGMILLQLYQSKKSLIKLGVAIGIATSIMNIFIASSRAISAIISSETWHLSMSLWDPVFFIGSIGTAFAFPISFFIIGSSLLTKETQLLLERERDLSQSLTTAIEDQKNLQQLLLHEMKRPINAIHAALQAEKDDTPRYGRLDDNGRKLRRHIAEASTLLEGIGKYEELSALFQNPNKTMVATHVIAEDLRLKWRIRVNIADGLSDVYADRFLIDIALGNLVENARKFGKTEEGTSVTISSISHYILLDVKDDGPGIPKAEWAKVWGKFYRIGLRSENAVRGCGLGLHAVKIIAEVHGGYAEIVSQVPSVVRFALPRAAKGPSDVYKH